MDIRAPSTVRTHSLSNKRQVATPCPTCREPVGNRGGGIRRAGAAKRIEPAGGGRRSTPDTRIMIFGSRRAA